MNVRKIFDIVGASLTFALILINFLVPFINDGLSFFNYTSYYEPRLYLMFHGIIMMLFIFDLFFEIKHASWFINLLLGPIIFVYINGIIDGFEKLTVGAYAGMCVYIGLFVISILRSILCNNEKRKRIRPSEKYNPYVHNSLSTRRIISIIILIVAGFLIGNMFIPYIVDGSYKYTVWDIKNTNVLILTALILTMVVYLLQLILNLKKNVAEIANYGIGYVFIHYYTMYTALVSTNYHSAGLWLGLCASFVLLLLSTLWLLCNDDRKKPKLKAFDPETGDLLNE